MQPLFALVAGFIGFAGYFGEYKGWNKGADERDTSVIQMVPRREGSMITEHGMTKKMVPDGNFTYVLHTIVNVQRPAANLLFNLQFPNQAIQ